MTLTKLLARKRHIHVQSCFSVCRRLKSSEDYEYIQRSKVPTFHFQASLPRLPIPELEKTCERYLAAQQPLLKSGEFEKTKDHVSKFREAEGKELHEKLKEIDKQNKHTSYISEPWFDMYLRDRVPLPINYNPLIVIMNNPEPEYNDQVIRASNMLISSLRFMKSLRAEILEPEVFHLNPKKSDTDTFRTVTRLLPSSISWYGAYLFKAFPLDMSQYGNLFNATRIPEVGKDRLFQNKSAKHTLVMRKGHFYIFDVLDRDGNILKPNDILACMKYIAHDNVPPAEYPIGVLTAGNRDSWAQTRKHLESIGNSEVFNLIDSSFFNICLDDVELKDDRMLMVRNFLHGDGCNRWFDKSFSLLFSKDGITAINFEHSWGDGVAVLRYLQDVFKDSSKKPYIHPDTQPSNIDASKHVQRLDFKLDDTARNAVNEAKKLYEAFYSSLDFNIMEFLNFGKKVCKNHQVSPDSVMQLGFQLAFYKQAGKCVATYESCSTAAFKHGRTETMRPCTLATKLIKCVQTCLESPVLL
ncbi:carnitine O-palmitoyltransferase 2, mitochondrial isoform X2 [Anabrus simplex]|uniref:carnitine O-palmitoyltransferase 2, mitochondrial isoform X2 n=1 Tax=Anabrus simplex TaxID=316456 RepID=UPI0034DD1DDD